MPTDATVWHAVIRQADGTLRCMDPGCGFNKRRPALNSHHLHYHRASDIQTVAVPSVRSDGPDRRATASSSGAAETQ